MTNLEQRQNAGRLVEDKMFEILIAYSPVHELKVSDVIYIARAARTAAFEAFDFDQGA